MTETPNFPFRLTASEATEAAKIANMNENASIADVILTRRVLSRTTTAPPGSPANGAFYIVPASGVSGAWVGHERELAFYFNGWIFGQPASGARYWVVDEALHVHFDESVSPSAWVTIGGVSNAFHDNVAGEIAALTEKVAPVAGDMVLAEDSENSNNKIKIDVANLGAGGGGANAGKLVRVSHSTGQTFSNASNDVWEWDTEDFEDDAAFHDTVTNNSRIHAPFTGRYELTYKLTIGSNNAEIRFDNWVALNRALNPGTPPHTFFSDFPRLRSLVHKTSGTSFGHTVFMQGILSLTATDYIQLGNWVSPVPTFTAAECWLQLKFLG